MEEAPRGILRVHRMPDHPHPTIDPRGPWGDVVTGPGFKHQPGVVDTLPAPDRPLHS
jgi:hypothetical protein